MRVGVGRADLSCNIFVHTHFMSCFQLYTMGSGIKQDELFSISFRDIQQRFQSQRLTAVLSVRRHHIYSTFCYKLVND
jgi:hypothetical protein